MWYKPAVVVPIESWIVEGVALVGIAGVGLAGAPVLPADAMLAGLEGTQALIDVVVFWSRRIPVLKGILPRLDTCKCFLQWILDTETIWYVRQLWLVTTGWFICALRRGVGSSWHGFGRYPMPLKMFVARGISTSTVKQKILPEKTFSGPHYKSFTNVDGLARE